MFVLLGSDKKAHLYKFTPQNGMFTEEKTQEHLVEIPDSFIDIPTYIDFKKTNDKKRLTAVGLESGDVFVYVTDTATNTCIFSYTTQHDSPIVKVVLFATIPNMCKTFPESLKGVMQKQVSYFSYFHFFVHYTPANL